jgi:hypothetical protein
VRYEGQAEPRAQPVQAEAKGAADTPLIARLERQVFFERRTRRHPAAVGQPAPHQPSLPDADRRQK